MIFQLLDTFKSRMSVFRKPSPIRNSADFGAFLATRSAFIAQKTLYGYVKTRMGMKYPAMFEDEAFIESLNIAKWQTYAACTSDLAIFMAAQIYRKTGDRAEAAKIASHWHGRVIAERFSDPEFNGNPGELTESFANRLALIDWNHMLEPEGAFTLSPKELVRWAPIEDNLKKMDAPLVKNSIRFQWQRIRSDFTSVFDVEAFLADWRRSLTD
jgi:hypothetical protein